MPRPTDRGWALLALAAATYAGARVLGAWELYLFAYAFFAIMVLAWLLVTISSRKIRVDRDISPERPIAGDEPRIAFVVTNHSLTPGPQLLLRNRLGGISDQDLEVEMGGLGPKAQRAFTDHLDAVNRGVHVLPPVEAQAEDPLGLVRTWRPVGGTLPLVVYPRLTPLDSCAVFPDLGSRYDWAGRRRAVKPGALEFHGVRPHQPGEPLSRIDWKSTAKTGTLMMREMEEAAGSEVVILLDGTAARVAGETPHSNYELAVQAAGSMADFALRTGRTVDLLVHGRTFGRMRLNAGQGGRLLLRETLAHARADADEPLVDVLQYLHSGIHHPRSRSVTVVSMSLDRRLHEALIALSSGGTPLSLLYVPPRPFAVAYDVTYGGGFFGDDPPDDAPGITSTAVLTDDDRALLLALASAGIPSITLQPGDDLATVLSVSSLSSRSRPGAQTRPATGHGAR